MGEKQKQRNETNAVALPMASAQSLGENLHSAIIIVGCSSSPLSLNADKKPLISFICFLVAHGTAAVSTILLIALNQPRTLTH